MKVFTHLLYNYLHMIPPKGITTFQEYNPYMHYAQEFASLKCNTIRKPTSLKLTLHVLISTEKEHFT